MGDHAVFIGVLLCFMLVFAALLGALKGKLQTEERIDREWKGIILKRRISGN